MINPNLLSLLTQLNQQPQRLGQSLLGGGLPDLQMPEITMPSATSLLGMGDLPKSQPAVRMPFESGVPQLQTPVVSGRSAQTAGSQGGGEAGGLFSALGQGMKSKIADPDYMLALGTSLLQGPSRTPIKFGQSLGQGLLAGQEAQKKRELDELTSLLTQATIAEKLGGVSGPFKGSGLTNQSWNTIYNLAEKVRSGDATTDELSLYKTAEQIVSRPRVETRIDPETQETITVKVLAQVLTHLVYHPSLVAKLLQAVRILTLVRVKIRTLSLLTGCTPQRRG